MKVGIVGSREYPSLHLVTLFVNMLPPDTVIVSGHARGVDMVAEDAAYMRGMQREIFKADWEHLGRGAGFIRNEDIVRASDVIVAFWDGVSKGTKHTIDTARREGKPVLVVGVQGNEAQRPERIRQTSFDIGVREP